MQALLDRMDLMVVIFFLSIIIITPIVVFGVYIPVWWKKISKGYKHWQRARRFHKTPWG